MQRLLAKLADWLHVAMHFNPLNDWLYPLVLDKYGHAAARRVCSALAILAMLTVVPPLVLLVWVYNSALDLVLNVGWGWMRSMADHVQGLLYGQIGGYDDDEDGE